jgi:short-subunit dehydrogenase
MARRDAAFRARYGPWAVVAGASEGLGAAYAAQLAEKGLHLVVIARRKDPLEDLAVQLAKQHGVEVRPLALDLASDDAGSAVAAATDRLEVGLLIYNAALSIIGPFFDRPLDDHLTEIMVNCRAPMTLAYLLGQPMISRGRGGIVLTSSLSSTMGSALIANYAATKAYNLVLAEGLWEELRLRGVDVMACCPAAVSTPGYIASDPKGRVSVMTPAAVASQTLDALGRYPSFIPGLSHRLQAFALRRLVPRRRMVRIMGDVMRNMYPHDRS